MVYALICKNAYQLLKHDAVWSFNRMVRLSYFTHHFDYCELVYFTIEFLNSPNDVLTLECLKFMISSLSECSVEKWGVY